jgi:hypothetical protein
MKRFAVIAAFVLAGCSGSDVCGPSTCADGCCTASGECVAGDLSLACGGGGNACNVCPSSAPVCRDGLCHESIVAGGQDAGSDAGVDGGVDAGVDAGGPVETIAGRIIYYRNPTLDESTCPVTQDPDLCNVSSQVVKAKVPSLKAAYAGCYVMDSGDAGVVFDCQGLTEIDMGGCSLPDGGNSGQIIYRCQYAPYTVADFCAWQLP